jgi:hypothetical protein
MKNINLPLWSLVFLSVLIFSCSKEEEQQQVKTETITKTEIQKQIDTFFIDYTTQMVYTVTVLSGNHVSMGSGKASSVVSGAKVTALQGENKITLTTDETGIAIFKGLYKGALTVAIEAADYTSVNYLVSVNNFVNRDSANKSQSTQVFVSNQIPIFKTKNDGAIARIIGRVTYQRDLTNSLRETVPQNTVISAYIDASDEAFTSKYLRIPKPTNDSVFGGKILQIAYKADFYDSTDANGNYDIILPAAIDGLPFKLMASDLVNQQVVFENTGVSGFNRTKEYRTVFSANQIPTPVPAAGGADIAFVSGSGALANAAISGTGQINRITVTNGGTGYTAPPRVTISGGGGSGATATATINLGVVTNITITNGGAGYTSDPIVTISSGGGAIVNASIGGGGSVSSIQMINTGSGYTSAPVVSISPPSLAGGVPATATAQVQNGNVTAILINNSGSGYTSNPTVTIAAPPAGGTNASAVAQFSGFSVQNVSIADGGLGYTGNPTVVFDQPNLPGGTRAQGIATIDPTTGKLIGFTITNPGSGYTSAPGITLNAGSGATADASFSGRIVTGIQILDGGANYDVAPLVRISGGGGSGAEATATVLNGRIASINLTNSGSGYTSAPNVELISGEGAQASVVVSNGQITAINLVNGGFNYTGAPRIIISPSLGGPGSGATATATINPATRSVTGITITNPGTGYLGGNTPSVAEPFSITPSLTSDKLLLKPGGTYVRDIHYGTGVRLPD